MNGSLRHPILAILRCAGAAAMALVAATCAGQQVTVTDAWARAMVSGQTTAGAYATLASASDAFLVGASSPVAERVEIHRMSVEDGIMRMRSVPRIELPAHTPVRLAPGGYHLMLIGVNRRLRAGDKLSLVFTFALSGTERISLQLEAEVRAAGATGAHHH